LLQQRKLLVATSNQSNCNKQNKATATSEKILMHTCCNKEIYLLQHQIKATATIKTKLLQHPEKNGKCKLVTTATQKATTTTAIQE
jgi:hypothetical protein